VASKKKQLELYDNSTLPDISEELMALIFSPLLYLNKQLFGIYLCSTLINYSHC